MADIQCIRWGGVFLQCVLFHWLAYHSLPISSLWHDPLHFWSTYLPKLTISLLIASPVFLFHRKYWTIYVSALLNVWILAEVVYYRSTRIFISADSFFLLKELHGFEGSIGMYFSADMLLLFIPLLLTVLAVILFDNRKRALRTFALVFVCGYVFSIAETNGILMAQKRQKNERTERFYFSSVSMRYVNETCGSNINIIYVKHTSVVHAFIYTIQRLLLLPFERPFTMNEAEINEANRFCNPKGVSVLPAHPLVLILVESLENWAISPSVTPNLYQFMQSHSVVYATRTQSQTKAGNSADGQMIFNTGLLPTQEGVVVNKYAHNVFPSLSDNYSATSIICQIGLGVWNQYNMNQAYHIDSAFVSSMPLDHEVFHILDSISDTANFDYILTITMASHSPFKACSHYSSLALPEDMPANMRNYLLCLNYTDSCWGSFLQRIDTDSVLHNSVVCFMGDHIIFDPIMRQEFQSYCDNKGLDFQPQEAYTAFVAYSPELTQSVVIEEPTYQMDAYPTILHLTGADNYYWRGFGVNLTDTAALHHRPISEQDAYILSDKLIRANYFKEYVSTAE